MIRSDPRSPSSAWTTGPVSWWSVWSWRPVGPRDLDFTRLDHPEVDPPDWRRFVTVRIGAEGVETGSMALDYYGSLQENYERHNPDYQRGQGS